MTTHHGAATPVAQYVARRGEPHNHIAASRNQPAMRRRPLSRTWITIEPVIAPTAWSAECVDDDRRTVPNSLRDEPTRATSS